MLSSCRSFLNFLCFLLHFVLRPYVLPVAFQRSPSNFPGRCRYIYIARCFLFFDTIYCSLTFPERPWAKSCCEKYWSLLKVQTLKQLLYEVVRIFEHFKKNLILELFEEGEIYEIFDFWFSFKKYAFLLRSLVNVLSY